MGFWRLGKLHLSREMNTSMVSIGDKKMRKKMRMDEPDKAGLKGRYGKSKELREIILL